MAKLLFDKETFQPACVLLQAALGGNTAFLNEHFDADYWTLSPVNLAMAEITPEQAKKLKLYLDKKGVGGARRRR